MSEPFHCGNCGWVEPLDVHGRCVHCGSEAVCPEAKMPSEVRPGLVEEPCLQCDAPMSYPGTGMCATCSGMLDGYGRNT